MKTTDFWGACLFASMFLVAAENAHAGKSDDTLRIAFAKEFENMDGYFNTAQEGVIMQRTVWDSLLYRDPHTGGYSGNLATKWKWVDDVTIDFDLRKEVKFHNGADFTADDVVYTVNWVADPSHGVKTRRNVNWMKSAEKLGAYKVRLHLKKPFPAALEYLSGPVPIYPSAYYAKVGPGGMGLHPVGTGPYKVISVEPGKHFTLEKFEDYFKNGPKGRPKIGRLDIRTIPDINTQITELFGGGLDYIDHVPADQAEKLELMDRFTVINQSTMRIGYIEMCAAGPAGAKNPMTDVRVRRAVAYAIDRRAIVDGLLKGESKVVDAACFPTQFGCIDDVPKYEYNPKKAKKLLAEAGYPNGFAIDFYVYRDREYAEAIMTYLKAVGVRTNFKFLQYSALNELRMKQVVPMSFQTWGSYRINDVSAITSAFFKFGPFDTARDGRVKEWLDIADSSIDPGKRKEYYAKALRRIADRAYWAPLFSYNTNYVFTKDLNYEPTTDAIPRFFQMSWK